MTESKYVICVTGECMLCYVFSNTVEKTKK